LQNCAAYQDLPTLQFWRFLSHVRFLILLAVFELLPKTCNFTICSIFSNSSHVGWCTASSDTILKLDTLVMIQICKNFILFVLYFKNYLEIDVKFKLQKCAAYQDLPTLQFWSKSHYPFWQIMQIRKKEGWNLKKIFSSETSEPISTHLR
jgi:hypothetical protein